MRVDRVWIAFLLLTLGASVQSQIVRHCNDVWVSPSPDQVYRLAGYEVTERFCSDGESKLCVFLKRRFDRQPILLYRHHRAIVLTLGHLKRLVLINDWEATKSGTVLVVDLKAGTKKQIDKQAVVMYARHARPDRRLILVPEACAFSRDDKLVLIEMAKEDVSAATIEESNAASRTYRAWSYAVDARTGKVMREYRRKIPAKWW